MKSFVLPFSALALASGLALSASPASALTMQECSAKYKVAKDSNTLNGQSWNAFRAANCSDSATPAAAAPAPKAAPAPTPAPAAAAAPASDARAAERARQKQCGAEWRANKATLKAQYPTWPKYWSACNTRIKTTGK